RVEPGKLHGADDTYNRRPRAGRAPALVKAPPDDLPAGKEAIGPGAIDDDDRRRVRREIARLEQSAALEAQPDRLEEPGRRRNPERHRLALSRGRRPVLEVEVVDVAGVLRWTAVGNRRRFDARQRREAVERPGPEGAPIAVPCVGRPR